MVIANKCTAITTEKAVIRRGSQTAIEITVAVFSNAVPYLKITGTVVRMR